MRNGHHRSDQHRSCSKGNAGQTAERWSGALRKGWSTERWGGALREGWSTERWGRGGKSIERGVEHLERGRALREGWSIERWRGGGEEH